MEQHVLLTSDLWLLTSLVPANGRAVGVHDAMQQPESADDASANYVFGPVPSRRLGQSLSVDPIPFKTCNWNCVYCQLGRTSPLTTERKACELDRLDVFGDYEDRFLDLFKSGD